MSVVTKTKIKSGNPCKTLRLAGAVLLILATLPGVGYSAEGQNQGVTPTALRVGAVMDLEGESKMRGQAIKTGLEAALKDEKAHGREIVLTVLNDSFDPQKAVEATRKLIEQGVFAMVGNTGGPTVKAALPILAEHKIPAVGFPIGVDFLRPGVGDIINFRPSFGQEAKLVMETALAAGVKPQELCFYLPNDVAGISNLKMAKALLEQQPNMAKTVAKLDQIIALPDADPNRNGIGPVGFYMRHTQTQARPGYESLKAWEKATNTPCRLVMMLGGSNTPTSSFIGYSKLKNETGWRFSVTSQLEIPTFLEDMKKYRLSDRVLLTQVVPTTDSALPIVTDARKALGDTLDSSSLEGYIVGKMFLAILRATKGELTRANFLEAVRGRTFDLGGLALDFTKDNQGSDLVQMYALEGEQFKSHTPQEMQSFF